MALLNYLKNQFRHDRNVKRKLDKISVDIAVLGQQVRQNTINYRADQMRDKVMHCTESGVSDERLCDEEVIVSLTTFGERIYEVYLTIESIMQGTIKPNRIVLWLSEQEFKDKPLPITLQRQQSRGLQIEYCEDIRSFKKIIPTLEKYPEAAVITIDDDIIYGIDFLENLVNSHLKYPLAVCANRMHRIKVGTDNRPLSYLQWDMEIKTTEISNLNFLTGVGGNLYPSHCFKDEFFNKTKFMELCPYGDDIWINAMIWMSNRNIIQSYTHSDNGCDYIEIRTFQKDALCNQNTDMKECRNDIQIKAVFDYYDLYHYLLG